MPVRPRHVIIVFSLVSLLFLWATNCSLYQKTAVVSPVLGPGVLVKYASFNDQVAGVAVSHDGRLFVSFPSWDKRPLYSVAEVKADGSLRPFPNKEWNVSGIGGQESPNTRFLSAQGLFVDLNNVLWILDATAPFSRVVAPEGAKLVGIDLDTDQIKKVIRFDTSVVVPGSYLQNVCVDQWESYAYLSDAGTGAIVVTNLDSGQSRRVLAGDRSTKAEHGIALTVGGKQARQGEKPVQFQVSGLALDNEGEDLHYHALTAHTLYRIQTRYLNDPLYSAAELSQHVEQVTDTGPVDGMAMGSYDNLYLTAPEEHAIKRYRESDNSLVTVAHDDTETWEDSLCTASGEILYVAASQFDRLPYFNGGEDKRVPPYTLFRVLPLGGKTGPR